MCRGLILEAANSLLVRLRYVLRVPTIHPLQERDMSDFSIRYLNDDGSDLEKEKGKALVKGRRSDSVKVCPVSREMWIEVLSLPRSFKPKLWDSLLIDAKESASIGESIVLAATALEIFIPHVLDQLSKRDGVNNRLWEWIMSNGWKQKPSIDDQYSTLLKIFSGKS